MQREPRKRRPEVLKLLAAQNEALAARDDFQEAMEEARAFNDEADALFDEYVTANWPPAVATPADEEAVEHVFQLAETLAAQFWLEEAEKVQKQFGPHLILDGPKGGFSLANAMVSYRANGRAWNAVVSGEGPKGAFSLPKA